MNQAIRELFPAAQNSTYLNSAAIAPLPTATVKAVTSQLEDVANNGSANMCDWFETKGRVRNLVASMLGVRADDIGFTRNTSDGLCAVASGMSWNAGGAERKIAAYDRRCLCRVYGPNKGAVEINPSTSDKHRG